MTSTTYIMWIMVAFTMCFLLSSIRIARYDVNSKDCPKDIKDAFFKKHPGAKWMFDMKESLDRVNNHIKNEVVVFLKERTKEERIEMAKKMKRINMSIEEIIEITGLTKEQVDGLTEK